MHASFLLPLGLGAAVATASPVDPASVTGGIQWFCPAMGILTGLSIATGQWIQAATLVVTAVRSGCFA